MYNHYSDKDYIKTMKLLRVHKNNAKVSRIMKIPTSTVRNWKLGYCRFSNNKNKIDNKALDRLGILLKSKKSIPQISKELDLPYTVVFPVVKRHFTKIHNKRLKNRYHILSEDQKKINSDLAYVLGVVFGDGYIYGKDMTVGLGTIDEDFRDVFAATLERWARKKPFTTFYLNRGRIHYQCRLWSKDTGKFLHPIKKLGRVPTSIRNSDNAILKIMFIRGFADSEGGVMKGSIGVFNKKKLLLKDIMKMLIQLGLDKNHMHINCDKKGVYCLLITGGENLRLFEKKIKFSIKRKQNKLRAAVGI